MWTYIKQEVIYRMTHWSTYIFAIVMITYFVGDYFFSQEYRGFPCNDIIFSNSPTGLMITINDSIFIIVCILAFFIHSVMKRISKASYNDTARLNHPEQRFKLLGIILGCIIVSLGIFTCGLILFQITGMTIGKELFTVAKLEWYINPILLSVLPNVYIICAILFFFGVKTKKAYSVFIIAAMFIIYEMTLSVLALFPSLSNISKILVPTSPLCYSAISSLVERKSINIANSQTIVATPLIIVNRLAWMIAGSYLLFLSIKKRSI